MKNPLEQIFIPLFLACFASCNSTEKRIIDEKLLQTETSQKIKSTNEDRQNRLELQLRNAHTILLVSHEQTYGPIFNKKDNGYIEAKSIVEDGIINKKVILESRLIAGQEKEKLISILTEKVEGSPIALATCFDPHHALIFTNKKDISYIEFCFACGGVSTDKLEISSDDFDKEKWNKIYTYINNKIQIKE
jgi:hypothetical protein